VGSVVVFVHGREFGFPVVMTGVIVIGVVMAGMIMGSVLVLVLGMFGRVVSGFVRGRFVYRVTHGLSL
jgi:hypothetical protein